MKSTQDRPKGEGKWKNTQSSNAFWDRRVGEGKEGGKSKKGKVRGTKGQAVSHVWSTVSYGQYIRWGP